MKRLVLGLSLLALLVSAHAHAAQLPWTRFSEMPPDILAVGVGACPGNGMPTDVLQVVLARGGKGYMLFYAENGRVVFVVFESDREGARPLEVGAGRVGADQDVVPPLTWRPARLGEDLCSLLIDQTA